MKKIFGVGCTVFLLLCVSIIFAQNNPEKIKFSIDRVDSEDVFQFIGVIPAAFPSPSKNAYLNFSCNKGLTSDYLTRNNQEEVDKWAKSLNIKYNSQGIDFGYLYLGCKDGHLFAKAKSFAELIRMFTSSYRSGSEMSYMIGNESLSFPDSSFLFTNYRDPLILNISQTKIYVSATSPIDKPIVGAKQDGDVIPVFFEGKSTPFSYNSSKPVFLYVKADQYKDFWQKIIVKFNEGSFEWWRDTEGIPSGTSTSGTPPSTNTEPSGNYLSSLDPNHAFQGNVTAATAQGVDDLDCRDFTSQSEAQAYFDAQGGSSSNNVASLDWNHNGKPCEVNEVWAVRSTRWSKPSALPTSTPAPTTSPAPTPTRPTAAPTTPPSTGKKCWVKGYYKKNGTYVAGYWRDC